MINTDYNYIKIHAKIHSNLLFIRKTKMLYTLLAGLPGFLRGQTKREHLLSNAYLDNYTTCIHIVLLPLPPKILGSSTCPFSQPQIVYAAVHDMQGKLQKLYTITNRLVFLGISIWIILSEDAYKYLHEILSHQLTQ